MRCMRMLLAVLFAIGAVSFPADAAPANPLLGQALGPLSGVRWATPGGKPDAFAKHKLTIIRWWTTSCPHCSTSVPALSRLWKKYRAQGLHFVAMYHHKGGRAKTDAQLKAYLRKLGFEGTLARDDRWTKLRDVMRRAGFRSATSISVAVDAKGVVRWAHAGPRIHYSKDPRYAGAHRDMQALTSFVAGYLAPKPEPPHPNR